MGDRMAVQKKTEECASYEPSMGYMWKKFTFKFVIIAVFTALFYVFDLWVITAGSSIMGLTASDDYAVLAAAVMAGASIVAFKKKHHMMMHGHPEN
jgi:hypothetical protein